MKVLIIDNKTIRLEEIKKLLTKHDISIVKVGALKPAISADFDLVILTGSSTHPVVSNSYLYRNEIKLINSSETPIIGICLGFELIASTFGAKLTHLNKKSRKLIDISIANDDHIFNNLPNFKVYEAHRWVIKTLPTELTELAKSKDGIEAFKHKTRKIYGFQFHPEMFTEKSCGDEIFNNTLKELNLI